MTESTLNDLLATDIPTPSDTSWQSWYERPLSELSEIGGEGLQGIFSPSYDRETVERYVHSQFLAEAEVYAHKYRQDDYHHRLMTSALQRLGITNRPGLRVLDIGSGAGNSVFPLIRALPDAEIIASDFSVDLLVRLREIMREQHMHCHLLQLNAEELDFAPGTFDLITGSAILHHLFSPEKAIAGCARILRPGGVAFFFEPFENGSALVSLAFDDILNDTRSDELPDTIIEMLRAILQDNAVRRGRDKSAEIFQRIDDKWLFSQTYIREHALKAGFHSCEVQPMHGGTVGQIEMQTETLLRLARGVGRDALPLWAWRKIRRYDSIFSDDVRNEMLLEGCIVLRK